MTQTAEGVTLTGLGQVWEKTKSAVKETKEYINNKTESIFSAASETDTPRKVSVAAGTGGIALWGTSFIAQISNLIKNKTAIKIIKNAGLAGQLLTLGAAVSYFFISMSKLTKGIEKLGKEAIDANIEKQAAINAAKKMKNHKSMFISSQDYDAKYQEYFSEEKNRLTTQIKNKTNSQ